MTPATSHGRLQAHAAVLLMASTCAACSDSPTAPRPAQPFFTAIRERLEAPFPGVTSATVAAQSAGGTP